MQTTRRTDDAPEGESPEEKNEKTGFLHRVADRIESSWPEILIALSSVGMGTTRFLRPFPADIVWTLSAAGFIFGSVLLATRRPTRSQLLREKANLAGQVDARELDLLERLEQYLATLTNETFQLSDQCRISLYRREEQRITLIGRYSKNISFDRKGRIIYPIDQGCIGEALRTGTAVMHCRCDPESNLSGYISEMEQDWGMPPEVTTNINMKSRHMYALALENGTTARRIGVLVVESVEKDSFDVTRIEQILDAEEQKKLTSFLVAPESPQTEVAEEGDF